MSRCTSPGTRAAASIMSRDVRGGPYPSAAYRSTNWPKAQMPAPNSRSAMCESSRVVPGASARERESASCQPERQRIDVDARRPGGHVRVRSGIARGPRATSRPAPTPAAHAAPIADSSAHVGHQHGHVDQVGESAHEVRFADAPPSTTSGPDGAPRLRISSTTSATCSTTESRAARARSAVVVAEGHADDHGPRRVVPPWCAEPVERRNELDPAAVRSGVLGEVRRRSCRGLPRATRGSRPTTGCSPRPPGSAAAPRAARPRCGTGRPVDAPGTAAVDRGHDRAAGAEGGLGHARLPAPMGEEGGVGVAQDTGQPNALGQGGEGQARAVVVGRGDDPGQHRHRDAEGSRRSSLHSARWRGRRAMVREALPASMTCAPVRCQAIHESTVPRHSSPASERDASGSNSSSSHAALTAENIGSRGRPLIRRTSSAMPGTAEPPGTGPSCDGPAS